MVSIDLDQGTYTYTLRLAVLVDLGKGQTADDLYSLMEQAARSNDGLRRLEVLPRLCASSPARPPGYTMI